MSNNIMPAIRSLKPGAIYAFVDNKHKRHFIYFSASASILEISKLIHTLQQGIHMCKDFQDAYNKNTIELVVLETFDYDIPTHVIRASVGVYDLRYKEQGYTSYPLKRAPHASFHARIKVLNDFRHESHNRTPLVYLYAESKTRNRYIIGVFETMQEAEDYRDAYFPVNDGIVPYPASNLLTRKYVRDFGYRINLV